MSSGENRMFLFLYASQVNSPDVRTQYECTLETCKTQIEFLLHTNLTSLKFTNLTDFR